MYPHSTEKVKPRNKQINKQTNKKHNTKNQDYLFIFLCFLLELQGWALRLIVDRGAEGELYVYTFADHTCLQHSFYFDDQIIIPVRLMQLRCTWGLLWWRPAGVANTMRKTNCYKCVCLNIFIITVSSETRGNNVIHCTLTFYSQHPTRTHVSHYSLQKEDKNPLSLAKNGLFPPQTDLL